jgi:hypothetical protein
MMYGVRVKLGRGRHANLVSTSLDVAESTVRTAEEAGLAAELETLPFVTDFMRQQVTVRSRNWPAELGGVPA